MSDKIANEQRNQVARLAMAAQAASREPGLRRALALAAAERLAACGVRVPAAQQALVDALADPDGQHLDAHHGRIKDVAISPDGRWLATACDDGAARVWALGDLEQPAVVLWGHHNGLELIP